MRVLTVIPAIDKDMASSCLASITRLDSAAGIDAGDILLVDNTRTGLPMWGFKVHRDWGGHNLGVARSWNIGARIVLEQGYDYLTIMSQSMLFGPKKECTWMSEMATYDGADIIEAFGHSWHLIAINRRMFEAVGLFDENFYPGYFEAIDFCTRLDLCGLQNGWPRVWCNVLSRTVAAHSHLGDAAPLLAYYRDKWGGDKGHETFKLPWGDKPMDYFPHHTIPELAEAYKLKEWW